MKNNITAYPAVQPEGAELLPGAAVYVRVSDNGQLGRAGSEDGYSLPAQQQALRRKADELGLRIAKVYIERAESARTDARPVLKQMMRELPSLGVTHLLVHKVDRLARNRVDDGLLYRELLGMGITLVSATENIDETPAGRMMHGILATLAEFYSNNLALEIKKGLYEKHRQGGTPHRAPVGYRHERQLVGGQDIRWVEVDEPRARLVRLAFDMYATGEWSLLALTEHLKIQGLTSRATPKRPARPMGVSAIHRMLRNRYYIGEVTYSGKTVEHAAHEPLVSVETFEKVQKMLEASRQGRVRPQRHEQYLAGSLYCAVCGRRLVYTRVRNRHGKYYDYFCCLGRKSRGHGGDCTTGHYRLSAIEEGVEAVYGELRLGADVQAAIRNELERYLEEESGSFTEEIEGYRRRIEEFKQKQAKLVDLAFQDLVDEEVLRDERERLRSERFALELLIQRAETEKADLLAALDTALELRNDPQGAYVAASPFERRFMNRSIFTRIEIGPDSCDVRGGLHLVQQALGAWANEESGKAPDGSPLGSGLTGAEAGPPDSRRPRPGGAFGVPEGARGRARAACYPRRRWSIRRPAASSHTVPMEAGESVMV